MPIKRCTLENGEMGYQWGNHGKCYPNRAGAERQAAAAHAAGYSEKEAQDLSAEVLEELTRKHEAGELKLAAMGGYRRKRRRRGYSY